MKAKEQVIDSFNWIKNVWKKFLEIIHWSKIKNFFERYLSPYCFVLPHFFFFVLFAVVPLVMSFVLAFCKWDYNTPAEFVFFDNFELLFDFSPDAWNYGASGNFWRAVGHTLLYTVIETPICIIVPFILALLLNKRLGGFEAYRTILYIPAILSVTAVGTMFVVMLDTNLGVINKIIGTDVPWLTDMPYEWIAIFWMSTWWGVGGGNCVLYSAGLQDIPKELYEAAEMDGCNGFEKMMHITIPGLKNTFIYVITMTTLGQLQVMGQPMMLTAGDRRTDVAILNIYNTAFGSWKLGQASAMAIIMAFILCGFSIITLKRAIDSVGGKH